jgi:hypothetical protein
VMCGSCCRFCASTARTCGSTCWTVRLTGLAAITRPDPASSVLADRHYEIVDQHAASVLDEDRLRSFWDKLELTALRGTRPPDRAVHPLHTTFQDGTSE